ncbi:MAG: tetratricopeptide repeat protein [Kastovskya adunca ATA6-11-RM4]|jgi:tetratricopeptide (TPR) repeat protein|nr:tetratricopeptide repeat protein [Kastovskya adunca ATA6-11-RM4]
MIEQVADAFKREDYKTAARLLKQLVKEEPKNFWVRFYVGRLHEATGKLDEAEAVYRKLLQGTTNPKIMSQARQGLARLEAMEQEQRQQALTQATADPNSGEPGVLVLEPIASEHRAIAAQQFARIMKLDPYTARLQLPSRGWRLYRTGAIGELQFYTKTLQQAEIPCFCTALSAIQNINVFSVSYFNNVVPQASVVCQNDQGQLGGLTFNWSEVTARVEGLVPIFEAVLDQDARRKLLRKTKTLDYVQFCDLHLPARNSILRLCDRHYQFQQGIAFSSQQEAVQPIAQATTRINWNNLLDFLSQQLPQTPRSSDFTIFAETAVDFAEMLSHLPSHINLSRREDTPKDSVWDSAFQLYSGLVFLK